METYIKKNNILKLFSKKDNELLSENIKGKEIFERVNPNNVDPFFPEYDDLARLHFLITSRKVTTILEFGVGQSTRVLADAIRINKEKYCDFVIKNLRRSNPFELHSVDNIEKWINLCSKDIPINLKQYLKFHKCELIVSHFQGKLCTYYENLPNISPDFIYLDGPDQFSAQGNLRGLTTAHPDRMPMAADILAFEHFLQPGTLIVVDGRTANARFLSCNLQRNWYYFYCQKFDQHFFEMKEDPLGKYNKDYLNFVNKKT